MKVLFVFPNLDCGGYKPYGLTMLINIARQAGHEVRLFDTSFYDTQGLSENKRYKGLTEAGDELLDLKPVNLSEYNIVKNKKNVLLELRKALQDFQPQLVGFSVLSVEWLLVKKLLREVKSFNKGIYTVVGGVHAYADPEGVIQDENMDILCVGEGELVILDLLEKIEKGKEYTNSHGFWIKKDGKIYKNIIGQVVWNLDKLPYGDYDLYDDRLIYRVYNGGVYRSSDYVLNRGCPSKCSYCLYEKMASYNRDNAKMRKYSIERSIKELIYLKERYHLNFNRFQDASFLAVSEKYFLDYAKAYKSEAGDPFVVDAAPETLTINKIKALAEMGCVSISIGMEVGDEKRRRELCNKPVKNDTIIKAFDLANSCGLRTVSFLLIGFPHETRKDYWDIIRMVRRAKVKSPCIGFVYPFKGSRLRELAVRDGLFDEDAEEKGMGYSRNYPAIYNPNISIEEYRGLIRTFYLYAKFPEKFWPDIKKAESLDEQGNLIFEKYAKIYREEQLYNRYYE